MLSWTILVHDSWPVIDIYWASTSRQTALRKLQFSYYVEYIKILMQALIQLVTQTVWKHVIRTEAGLFSSVWIKKWFLLTTRKHTHIGCNRYHWFSHRPTATEEPERLEAEELERLLVEAGTNTECVVKFPPAAWPAESRFMCWFGTWPQAAHFAVLTSQSRR